MRRAKLGFVALSVLSGCSLLQGNVTPTSAISKVADTGRFTAEAADGIKKCDAFAAQTVAYPEETSIGGAIALSLAKQSQGGVFIELSPEVASLTTLDSTQWAGKKPAPGKGERTDLNRYLNMVGKGLAAFSERPTIDWTFMVLDSPTPNAFSAPGGYVFVTTGLLKMLDNEAQLAAVLGHEIGHVAGRHALNTYKKQKHAVCVSAVFAPKLAEEGGDALRAALGPVASQVQNLPFGSEALSAVNSATVFNPNGLGGKFIAWMTNGVADFVLSVGYGPELEKDADTAAAKMMIFAGYDVNEFEKVLGKLPDAAFLTPHPKNADRIAVVKAARAEWEGLGNGKAPALGPSFKVVK